ncbi:MAG: hypothetical protein KG029_13915 [Bacteroidetes bacterium]|nr:hypothetical protein [Bacteroidota bacterium]
MEALLMLEKMKVASDHSTSSVTSCVDAFMQYNHENDPKTSHYDQKVAQIL